MRNPGFIPLNFEIRFEPERGIRTGGDFAEQLRLWADRENRQLRLVTVSMEPVIELDGQRYVCRLAEPGLPAHPQESKNFFHFTANRPASAGFSGVDWVYLYRL